MDLHFTAGQTGALFDLDGVLLDTEGIYSQFWEEVAHRFPTGEPNVASVIKGMNLQAILSTYFPGEEKQREIVALLDEQQRTMRYRPFDGAMSFVDVLRRLGVRCCVVTSSDSRKMEAVAQQLPDFNSRFDAIITGDMVKHAKPHPECFMKGAKAIGRDIEHCYVFEDSINGLKAAKASGATVIALATTCKASEIAPFAALTAQSIRELDPSILPPLNAAQK